jgi:NADPH-dependent curcumin reductase CurA
MAAENLRVVLVARPEGLPKAGDFRLESGAIPEPAHGEVVVRQRFASVDPAMRGWMTDRTSYVPGVGLGEVMRAYGVGEVVASRADGLDVGERVAGAFGLQRYAAVPARHVAAIPPGIDERLALGPLGMTGMTAYFGLLDVGEPRSGDTVLVSAAAGAVGSMVGQIARIQGCRVVGIAGGEAKCRWITESCRFDAAIDYRTVESLDAAIAESCPDGVDVFFDNVGGATLDAALRRLNRGARVVICGAISTHNAVEPPPGPRNYIQLLVRRARMEGFIVMDYAERYEEARAAIGAWLAAERLEYRFHVVDGLERAPEALLMLFDGSNTGKLLVRVE